MPQWDFVRKAGVSLALYFERIPVSLGELPFVDATAIPEFPHAPEKGTRPAGTFFDLFTDQDEELVWISDRDDEMLGYERFNCGLPESSNNCLHLSPDRAAAR